MPGQKYYFEIAAVSGYGISPNSSEASAVAVSAGGGGHSGGGSMDWLALLGLGAIGAKRQRTMLTRPSSGLTPRPPHDL